MSQLTVSKLTVSKLAQLVGTSPDTLRYYERIGLLPPPERTASGYRLYDEAAAERVTFIKRAQRFGLRLDEIGELLDIKERGLCPCGHTRALLERRLSDLDEEMTVIRRLRDDIRHMLEDLPLADGQGASPGGELLQIRPSGKPPRARSKSCASTDVEVP